MKTLVYNIGQLWLAIPGEQPLGGVEMSALQPLEKAWFRFEDGLITQIGQGNLPSALPDEVQVDCDGGMVFPGFCDSHTHLVFADWRPEEFLQKIKGMSYAEIAAAGGGILNSAQKVGLASEEQLFESAKNRLAEVMRFGTAAIEVKSGYGLSLNSELKMLRAIARLKAWAPIPIRATLLGAHALPQEFKENRQAYIDMVVQELIPAACSEGLADYFDVFCDQGFFTQSETEEMLKAALESGLQSKIHANELGLTGGVQAGVKYNALTVDHLEHLGEEEINALKGSQTMPTLLPGTAFFLKLEYPNGRRLLDENLPVVLATDYNPGSSPSGNPWFIWSLACIFMKFNPQEALVGLTLNGAHAMGLGASHGSIWPGKAASFVVLPTIHQLSMVPYRFGGGFPYRTFIHGKELNSSMDVF
ncbi:MAG: imidazolonepropionase [Flavobacteriales bacterium]